MRHRVTADTVIDLTPGEQGFWVSIAAALELSVEFHYFAIGVGGHQQEGELTLLCPPGTSRHFIPMHFTAVKTGITALTVTVARQRRGGSRERKRMTLTPFSVKGNVPPSQALHIQPGSKMVIPPSLLAGATAVRKGAASYPAGPYGFGPYRFGPYRFGPYGFGPYGFGPYNDQYENQRSSKTIQQDSAAPRASRTSGARTTKKMSGTLRVRRSRSAPDKGRGPRKPPK